VKNYYLGVLLVVISALGYGMMPIFALYAYHYEMTVNTLLFLRFLLAAILVFGYLYFSKNKINITPKQVLYLFILGGLFFTMCSGFLFNAIRHIPASLAVLIIYIHPLIIAIISVVFEGQILTKRTIFAIILSFASLILVLGVTFNNINFIGVFFAIGSALSYTMYVTFGKYLTKKTPSIVTTGFVSLFASGSFLIMGTYTNTISFDFSPIAYLPLIGIVLFSTIVALSAYLKGMDIVGSTLASTLSMLDPLTTLVLSVILFKEQVSVLQLAGILGVLLGAAMATTAEEQQQIPSTP
jgi:drug/metabolite transporter (DMT)-like permease